MKKNLFGVFAFILAIVLCSFTQVTKKQQQSLVWFDVVSGVTSTTGGVLLSARPTGCEDDTIDLCARGFDVDDCTQDNSGGTTTYTLKAEIDPDTDAEDEGYEE